MTDAPRPGERRYSGVSVVEWTGRAWKSISPKQLDEEAWRRSRGEPAPDLPPTTPKEE